MAQRTLLITIDALRADHLSQFGYRRNTLPALDDLVGESKLYENAFANGSSTKSSIPSFITSRFSGLSSVESGPTIFTPLQKNGIETGAFHSNVLLSNEFDSIHGCDTYQDFQDEGDETWKRQEEGVWMRPYSRLHDLVQEYVDRTDVPDQLVRLYERLMPDSSRHVSTPYVDAEIVTDAALEWIRGRANSDLFLWVHYMEPHRPYGVSPDEPAFVETPIPDDELRNLMAKAGTRPDEITERERELLVDLYDSDIRYLSRSLDRLFTELESLGIWEDLAVIFSADHGEEFGEHGAYFHRNHPYDELIHVPLLVRSPSFEPGRTDELRQLLDLGPTLLERHGIDPPESFQGVSLRDDGSDYVVSNSIIGTRSNAVRSDEWKYIIDEDGQEELYHLPEDDGETNSVLGEHPEVGREMRDRIPDALAAFGVSNIQQEVDDGAAQRLKDLGYLE